MYVVWQKKGDLTRFVHLLIFKDADAQAAHARSAAVKRFEAVYRPELVGPDVIFTDYSMVATNQE